MAEENPAPDAGAPAASQAAKPNRWAPAAWLVDKACEIYGDGADREKLTAVLTLAGEAYVKTATDAAAKIVRGAAVNCERHADTMGPLSRNPHPVFAAQHRNGAQLLRAVGAAILASVGLPLGDMVKGPRVVTVPPKALKDTRH